MMTEGKINGLEEHWNKRVPTYPGVIVASQEAAKLDRNDHEILILSTWSAISTPKAKKQKTV